MKKINIVALVGMSGSGKTHASLLMKDMPGFNTIVSYTTRPKRTGEVNGVDHWYVGPVALPTSDEIVAYTLYAGYEYWTSWKQFKEDKYNVYVIDEKGLLDLMNRPGMAERVNLTKVLITRPDRSSIDKNRTKRDEERIMISDTFYDYNIQNDSSLEDFEEKIKQLCNDIKEQK